MVELFLAGARVVAAAIAEPAVAQRWDQPSVLDEQTVGGLCGHLARGAVWVVADYLDAGEPEGPLTYESAGEYFAAVVTNATDDDHRAVRERGAAVGADGPEALSAALAGRIDDLEQRLRGETADRRITVIGGAVMRVDDFLAARIVEQVVHLDDLARSIGRPGYVMPEESEALAITIGADIGRRRYGGTTMVRILYRDGPDAAALPVM